MTTVLRALRIPLAALLLTGAAWSTLRAEDAKPPAAPRMFDTPEAAMTALVEALKTNDDEALKALAGPGSEDVIQSGKDPIVARERRRAAKAAEEKIQWEDLDDGTKVAVLGANEWPMPLPLAPKDGKWFWDAEQGRDELLARRIGASELRTIDLLRTVVEAQEAYKAKDRDGDGVLEYAQKFVSTEGKKDGLFWIDPEGVALEDRSPLGAMFEELSAYVKDKPRGGPFGGYIFKLLTSQSACAPGGAYEFAVGENMTRGFAVLAVPAEYRLTGVKSFIISHHQRLLDKDLGPQGVELAKGMTSFAPDGTWTRVGDP